MEIQHLITNFLQRLFIVCYIRFLIFCMCVCLYEIPQQHNKLTKEFLIVLLCVKICVHQMVKETWHRISQCIGSVTNTDNVPQLKYVFFWWKVQLAMKTILRSLMHLVLNMFHLSFLKDVGNGNTLFCYFSCSQVESVTEQVVALSSSACLPCKFSTVLRDWIGYSMHP